jgi:hypothetical protein
MAEKRKPDLIILLKKAGKKIGKVELFDAGLWGYKGPKRGVRYRLRVNGKWMGKKEYYDLYDVRNMLWRSVKQKI